MGLLVACARGCGHTIQVTTEQINEAQQHGSALVVQHDKCPTEPDAVQRRFKITTTIVELKTETLTGQDEADVTVSDIEDPLSSIGSEVAAGSFKLALPALQKEMERQWRMVVNLADVIDQPMAQMTPDGPVDAPDQG